MRTVLSGERWLRHQVVVQCHDVFTRHSSEGWVRKGWVVILTFRVDAFAYCTNQVMECPVADTMFLMWCDVWAVECAKRAINRPASSQRQVISVTGDTASRKEDILALLHKGVT